MTLDLTVQLSLGRFHISVDEQETIKQLKMKIRQTHNSVAHVNLGIFRINVGGTYFSDESQTLQQYGVQSGDVLHFVKKSACPAAALDTEKKSDDE